MSWFEENCRSSRWILILSCAITSRHFTRSSSPLILVIRLIIYLFIYFFAFIRPPVEICPWPWFNTLFSPNVSGSRGLRMNNKQLSAFCRELFIRRPLNINLRLISPLFCFSFFFLFFFAVSSINPSPLPKIRPSLLTSDGYDGHKEPAHKLQWNLQWQRKQNACLLFSILGKKK